MRLFGSVAEARRFITAYRRELVFKMVGHPRISDEHEDPPHPSLSVRDDCIEPLGLTTTAAAKILGVTRQTLNNLINSKSGISADMAVRLDQAFGGGAETWLRLQMTYDLAQARQHEGAIKVKPVAWRELHEPRV